MARPEAEDLPCRRPGPEPNEVGVTDWSVTELHKEVADLRYALSQSQAELKLKDALIHDIDHRTKNTLQIAAAVLHMQGKRASDDVRAALSEASSRLVALAAAHNRLNRLDVDNRVRLDEYLAELCPALAADEPGGPTVRVIAGPVACRPEVAIPVGLLTSEALMNALKHAFPNGREGTIDVRLSQHGKKAELLISDDGVGRDPNRSDGLGTELIRTFAAQLDATLECTSTPNEGCSLRLRFDPDAGGRMA